MGEVIDLVAYRATKLRAQELRRLTPAEARELLRLFAPVTDAEARRAARLEEPEDRRP